MTNSFMEHHDILADALFDLQGLNSLIESYKKEAEKCADEFGCDLESIELYNHNKLYIDALLVATPKELMYFKIAMSTIRRLKNDGKEPNRQEIKWINLCTQHLGKGYCVYLGNKLKEEMDSLIYMPIHYIQAYKNWEGITEVVLHA